MHAEQPNDLSRWRHASDEVPDALRGVVDELRRDVDVPAQWRQSLTAAIQNEPRASAELPRAPRRIELRPLYAAAAALAFTTFGAFGTFLATSGPRALQIAATADSPGQASVSATRVSGDGSRVSVRFSLVAPGAHRVSVVGAFNQWDPSANAMQLAEDGVTWTATLAMPVGKHSYAFVIDGEVTPDPAAPASADDDFGVPNSFLLVSNSL